MCDGSGLLDCYCGGDRCSCGCPPRCPGCEECADPWPSPEYQRRMAAAIAAQTPDGEYFFTDEELYQLAMRAEEEGDGLF